MCVCFVNKAVSGKHGKNWALTFASRRRGISRCPLSERCIKSLGMLEPLSSLIPAASSRLSQCPSMIRSWGIGASESFALFDAFIRFSWFMVPPVYRVALKQILLSILTAVRLIFESLKAELVRAWNIWQHNLAEQPCYCTFA